MDDLYVESGEASEEQEDVAAPPRDDSGRAAAVWVSLWLVVSLLVSFILAVNGEARYAFQGMDSTANLTNACPGAACTNSRTTRCA